MNLYLKFAREASSAAEQATQRAKAELPFITDRGIVVHLMRTLFVQHETLKEAGFNATRTQSIQGYITRDKDEALLTAAEKVNESCDKLQAALDRSSAEAASPRTPRAQLIKPKPYVK